MKDMSYRDKMIILVISIIIILVAGFFALIKPKYNKLVADTATYETTKTEWDGIKQKLDAIPTLKDTITQAYNTAKGDAGIFINGAMGDVNDTFSIDRVNYVMDQYIQPAIDESNLITHQMEFGSAGTVNMEYYYYTPNVVTYALLEAADLNGNYAQTVSDELLSQTVFTERESAEMIAQNIAISIRGNRENLMTFLDKIKSDKNALLVNKVEIADYQFKGGLEETEEATEVRDVVTIDEEGNEVITQEVVTPENTGEGEGEDGWSEMALSVIFYNAKEIDTPDLGD